MVTEEELQPLPDTTSPNYSGATSSKVSGSSLVPTVQQCFKISSPAPRVAVLIFVLDCWNRDLRLLVMLQQKQVRKRSFQKR